MSNTTYRHIRLAYPHLWKPQAYKNSAPMYSASLMIPKDDAEMVKMTLDAIDNAKQKAVSTGIVTADKMGSLISPVRDGDKEFASGDRPKEFQGHWFVNARSAVQPSLIDKYGEKIKDPEVLYPGAEYHVSVAFYVPKEYNIRVACALNHVLKYADRERWDDRVTAEEAFKGLIETVDAKDVKWN